MRILKNEKALETVFLSGIDLPKVTTNMRMSYVQLHSLSSSRGEHDVYLVDLTVNQGQFREDFHVILSVNYEECLNLHNTAISVVQVKKYDFDKYFFNYLETSEKEVEEIEAFFGSFAERVKEKDS